MEKALHILNGDSTLHLFRQSDIEGDTFVWRDVLSEGPVHPEFNSDAFWELRNDFMTAKFALEPGQYLKDARAPFIKMANELGLYQEITLWFEYDLFCQVNMFSLIQWLGKQEQASEISLVCVGKLDESDKLFGLGEIAPAQYPELYNNRLKLGTREFTFASDVYEAYCSAQPDDLYTFVLMPFPDFSYLSDALESHFKRFPYLESGLTEIEQQMLSIIRLGETDHRKLVGKMLEWQLYYGFGDSQFFQILGRLEPLFEDFQNLRLKTDLSKEHVEKLLDRNYMLGGARVSDWYWDDHEKALTPKESAL